MAAVIVQWRRRIIVSVGRVDDGAIIKGCSSTTPTVSNGVSLLVGVVIPSSASATVLLHDGPPPPSVLQQEHSFNCRLLLLLPWSSYTSTWHFNDSLPPISRYLEFRYLEFLFLNWLIIDLLFNWSTREFMPVSEMYGCLLCKKVVV